MDSKASTGKRPTPTKTKAAAATRVPQDTAPIPLRDTVPVPLQDVVPVPRKDAGPLIPQDTIPLIPQDTIPRIPHDIIIEILDLLASDSDFRSLRACALVSGSWVQPCQRHLSRTAHITPASACRWLKAFPVQEDSPAHHVRELRIDLGQAARIPVEFFACIPWFTDVDRMSFLGAPRGFGRFSPLWEPSCWRLPRSVTTLTINTAAVTLVQVRDIIAQLPNLDDLVLSEFDDEDRRKWPGIGTVLEGIFSGRLMLSDASAGDKIIDMLLEIPSGLRFAQLEIRCTRNCLHSSAVRLAEACGKTLVKLSHTVNIGRESYHFPSRLVRARNIDADVVFRSKYPRHLRAVLQLFQVPKRSRGGVWL